VALFIASLLPLIFANRRVYDWAAVLSGVGVGLFIDEVGKFIQKQRLLLPRRRADYLRCVSADGATLF
jgi:hypothetical protein